MMKALLILRFRAFFAGLTAHGQKKKRSGKGTAVLYVFLYLYLIAVICGMMGFIFYSLAQPYTALGLQWLYFSMAGLMGLGFAVLGSVFTTQSQLYEAKDNALLLAMPIPPGKILLSRLVPLLVMNLLFAGSVMVPAMVVWAVWVEFSLGALLCQVAALLGVVVLAQTIACLFGWLLHLLFRRINKSLGSVIYMVIFLGAYFYVYSQASSILNAMAQKGEAIASALQSWAWPLYAMGKGCLVSWELLAFLAIAAAAFAAVYLVLSRTFLKGATASSSGPRRRALSLHTLATRSPLQAVLVKEWRKFLCTPVFLTNMGVGVVMMVGAAAAGIIIKKDIQPFIALMGIDSDQIALVLCAMLVWLNCTLCISAPTVSLEGKSLWILKSLPIPSRDVLLAKLGLHCSLAVPSGALAGLVLSTVYGCTLPGILLCVLVPALTALFMGLVGLLAGLKWARFDFISEAYPVKQSMAVALPTLGMMGLPLLLGLLYVFRLADLLAPLTYLLLCAGLLLGLCCLCWRLLMSWGIRRWESL